MKTHQQNLLATALTCALAATVTSARADDTVAMPADTSTNTPAATAEMTPAADPNAWKFGVTLPLWAPQINGSATVKGRHSDVNVNFSELQDHLDASFSLALAAQKGKFGLFGNVGYMKFDGGFSDALGGHTDWTLKFLVANAGGSYQLIKTENEHPFILTGTAGVRFWYTSTDLGHRDALNTRDFHGYGNQTLFDPVLGLRASQYLTQKLHLDVAADGGGFNISHDTDWTWSASGMVTYDFAKWFSASVGYQALALNESNGSGTGKNGVNLIFSGVAGALTFKF
ncbi:MAG TPA: hypothetical protein VL863_02360 [bacterium]|jgi:hypothetical protein|nr:hypothetical protein [bacterium]